MTLTERLREDMKAAMKSGQKDRLSVIRMLLNEVNLRDLKPEKPTEEQAVASYAKRLQKAIEDAVKVNRPEAAAALESELAVAQEYLPKKLSEPELEKVVDALLAATPLTIKQMGQAMGTLRQAHGDAIDAQMLSAMLKRKLK